MLKILPTAMTVLALISANAMARNLPADVVQTKDDLFLHGQPKTVLSKSISGIVEDKFNKDGALISHMLSASGHSAPFKAEIKKGRLIEISYSPSARSNAPAIRPLQYDDEGRATALNDHSVLPTSLVDANQASATFLVRIIRYEHNRQTHDLYINRAFARSIAFTFSDQDKLLSTQCIAGNCKGFIETQFGDFGPIKLQSADFETSYYYEQGLLSSETTRVKRSNQLQTVYYGDYIVDECGNWTQQASFTAPPSDTLRQRDTLTLRKIEYYAPCTQAK